MSPTHIYHDGALQSACVEQHRLNTYDSSSSNYTHLGQQQQQQQQLQAHDSSNHSYTTAAATAATTHT